MTKWVEKNAAELLTTSPRVMNYKIKTLGIEPPRAPMNGRRHLAERGRCLPDVRARARGCDFRYTSRSCAALT
jgi:hypothetical protein